MIIGNKRLHGWTQYDLDTFKESLSKSSTVDQALSKINAHRVIPLTSRTAYKIFKDLDLGAPGQYLKKELLPETVFYEDGWEIPVDFEDGVQSDTCNEEPEEEEETPDNSPIVFKPLDTGKELERILFIPDTHRPYHDKKAWQLMLKVARDFHPHTVVLLGDYQDMYSISDFDIDPRRSTQLKEELDNGLEGLEEVEDLKAQRVIYADGNHEDRLDRFLIRKSPQLYTMISVDKSLRITERGWHKIPYKRHGKLGKLFVTHDAGYAGIHAVHQTGQAYGASIAIGHVHQLAIKYFGTVTGERHVSATFGWLGNIWEAKYANESAKRYWQLGFGTGYMEKNGNFFLEAHPIVDNSCVVEGIRYKV